MSFDDDEEYTVKVRRCLETGNAVEERWHHADGDVGRIGAPARLKWDPHTFLLTLEEFWVRGMLQSPMSGKHPAQTKYDPTTGEPVCRVWMQHNVKHRVGDLPAVEFLRDGKPVRHEFWQDGHLFRQDGPPILNFDPTSGAIVSSEDQLPEEPPRTPQTYFPRSQI